MSNEEQNEPKLIVDEDWKTQVQREKEQAARQAAEGSAPERPPEHVAPVEDSSSTVTADTSATASTQGPRAPAEDLPPATFDFLVTMLATQAMVALGHLPDVSGSAASKDKPLAKHYIDLIGVLEEKTKGNLQPAEHKMLGDVLHSLRMAFVQS